MNFAAVGIKCPDHAGGPAVTHPEHRGAKRMKRAAVQRPMSIGRGGAPLTMILVAVNVLIYLAQLGGGASINANSGWIFDHLSLLRDASYCDEFGLCTPGSTGDAAGVANGEWWRLISSAFLHYGPIHLILNMLGLWWLGGPLEQQLGTRRFAMLYAVAGLAGSAGALLLTPNSVTVGASGAIFGIMGAMLILDYQATGSFAGPALTLIAINVIFSLTMSNISLGGHLGGLAGGALGTLALSRFGKGHVAYGRPGLVGYAALIGIGVVSVLVALVRAGSF
jgi:membrane associated rhomboid family serine protease